LPDAEYHLLSAAQQRMWLLTQLEGANKAYHIRISIKLTGFVDPVLFNEAFQMLLQRHEILRTVFIQDEDGNPRQKINKWSPEENPIRCLDFANSSDAAVNYCNEFTHRDLDIDSDALIQCSLVKIGHDAHQLLLLQHHLITDGWSM
jgi:hypothetical protein